MVRTLFGGSAVLTGALLLSALAFNAHPSVAEHLAAHLTQQTQQTTPNPGGTGLPGDAAAAVAPPTAEPAPAPAHGAAGVGAGGAVLSSDKANVLITAAAQKFTATAYALYGRTASGARVRRGVIAADRRVLPLGTRVRLEAGGYSGEYVVADTGGAVRGRLIDIWVPTTREAMRFGRRAVKLTILSYGARRAARVRRS